MFRNKFQAKVPEVNFHQNVCNRTSHVHLCYFVYLFTQIGVTSLHSKDGGSKEFGELVLLQQNLGESG